MNGSFADALARVLVSEGGKVDNPKDPGGRTNKGITQRVYNGWRAKSNLPVRDVYAIDDVEVEAIYRFQYWEPIMGDQLPVGVSYVVFDGAVNSGVGQSVKWLQRALGALYTSGIDGDMGAGTLGAVQAVNDYDALITRIIDRREAFLRELKTWSDFGRGWLRRINSVEAAGQAWASGSVGPAPVFIPDGNAKATIEDAKQAPGKGAADSATGGGVGAGGIAIAINQAQEQLTPYSAAGGWIQNIVVVLIVAGAVLAIGGIAYRFYANKRRGELSDALDLQPVSK
jgi:lysozyme family protein